MGAQGMRGVLTERFRGLAGAPRRFPVPLLCAVLWAAATIAHVHDLGWTNALSDLLRLQVFLLLGLFASLAAKLFAESRQWSAPRWLALTTAVLGLLATAVFLGPRPNDAYDSPVFLFMGPGVVLLTMVAPFLRRGVEPGSVWAFSFGSLTSALFGFVVAVLLALAAMALLAGLQTLFGVLIDDRLYADVWIFCLAVVWPWQTLAGVPGGFGSAETGVSPRWFAYLVGWLLVPVAVVYLAVLYAFAVSIVVAWELPQGQIGWLVAGFAAFGLAVWHAAFPLRDTGGRLVRAYLRFLHPALAMPTALLAIGTGVRIAEYGVTENRYGLALLAAWLAGLAIHGTVARRPSLVAAPASLAALLVAATFGPWGATAVSTQSQLARLESLLVDAGLLVEGRLVGASDGLVAGEIGAEVSRVLRHLGDATHRSALDRRLTELGLAESEQRDVRSIAESLGVRYSLSPGGGAYRTWRQSSGRAMDARGFDTAIALDLFGDATRRFDVVLADGPATLVVEADGVRLRLSVADRVAVEIDVAAVVEALRSAVPPGEVPGGHMHLMQAEASGGGLSARAYIRSIGAAGDREGFLSIDTLLFIGSERSD